MIRRHGRRIPPPRSQKTERGSWEPRMISLYNSSGDGIEFSAADLPAVDVPDRKVPGYFRHTGSIYSTHIQTH